MKICTECKRELPLEKFHRNRGRPDGRVGMCKDCRNMIARIKRSPDYVKRVNRGYYSREIAEYDALRALGKREVFYGVDGECDVLDCRGVAVGMAGDWYLCGRHDRMLQEMRHG